MNKIKPKRKSKKNHTPFARLKSAVDRIIYYTDKPKDSTCILFTGPQRGGYGRVCYIKGKQIGVHRIVWMLFNKKIIPKDKLIMHSCDIPSCINPNHLSLGTVKDNAIDMQNKGRTHITHHNPETAYGATLTNQQVSEIKTQLNDNILSMKELAKKYNVKYKVICCIRTEKHWKSIEPRIKMKRGCTGMKLKIRDVIEIKKMIRSKKYLLKDIAFKFNIDACVITDIKLNKKWAHVEEE